MTAYGNQKRLHGGGNISTEFSRRSRSLDREGVEDLEVEGGAKTMLYESSLS